MSQYEWYKKISDDWQTMKQVMVSYPQPDSMSLQQWKKKYNVFLSNRVYFGSAALVKAFFNRIILGTDC